MLAIPAVAWEKVWLPVPVGPPAEPGIVWMMPAFSAAPMSSPGTPTTRSPKALPPTLPIASEAPKPSPVSGASPMPGGVLAPQRAAGRAQAGGRAEQDVDDAVVDRRRSVLLGHADREVGGHRAAEVADGERRAEAVAGLGIVGDARRVLAPGL